MIWAENIPIWHMHYWGMYEKEAIPHLKKALLRTYSAGKFCGGRGEFFTEGKYSYSNVLHCESAGMTKFSGRESIHRNDNDRPLGWHEYHGGILFTRPENYKDIPICK